MSDDLVILGLHPVFHTQKHQFINSRTYDTPSEKWCKPSFYTIPTGREGSARA